jgi:hypothetical protein
MSKLPDPQREHYLPEPVHFGLDIARSSEMKVAFNHFLRDAVHRTVRHAVRWADHYRTFVPVSETDPSLVPQREGPLPADIYERETIVDELFDWFDRLGAPLDRTALSLYQGEHTILDQHDGMPGVFALKPEEFVELQQAWEECGLPCNLYYPARDQRTVIEPVEKHGGIVRAYRSYSPLQWERRMQAGNEPLQVPSEGERIRTFITACEHFAEAVRLRIAELSQRGQELDKERIHRLRNLHHEVNLAVLRARESLLPDGEGHSK